MATGEIWMRRDLRLRCQTLSSSTLQVKRAGKNTVVFTVWHGARKHVACLRTIKSLVENMITGVTKVRLSSTSTSTFDLFDLVSMNL